MFKSRYIFFGWLPAALFTFVPYLISAQDSAPAIASPAELEAQYNHIARHLDSGGDLYLVLNPLQSIQLFTHQLSKFEAVVKKTLQIPNLEEDIKETLAILQQLKAKWVDLGINEISGLGFSSRMLADKKHFQHRQLLALEPGADGSLWSLLRDKPEIDQVLKLLPPESGITLAFDFPLQHLIAEIKRLAVDTPLEGQVDDALQEMLRDEGVKLYTKSFDHVVGLSLSLREDDDLTAPIPDFTVCIRVYRPEMLEEVFGSHADKQPLGDTFHYQIPAAGLPAVYIAPIGKYIVLTSTFDRLKACHARHLGTAKGAFQALASNASLGSLKQANGFLQISPRFSRGICDLVQAQMKRSGQWLPGMEDIFPSDFSFESTVQRVRDGILQRSVSSLDGVTQALVPLMLSVAAIVGTFKSASSVTIPEAALIDPAADEQVRLKVTHATLAQLSAAIQTYRLKEGAYPARLNQLVKKKYIKAMPRDGWGHPLFYDATTGNCWAIINGERIELSVQ